MFSQTLVSILAADSWSPILISLFTYFFQILSLYNNVRMDCDHLLHELIRHLDPPFDNLSQQLEQNIMGSFVISIFHLFVNNGDDEHRSLVDLAEPQVQLESVFGILRVIVIISFKEIKHFVEKEIILGIGDHLYSVVQVLLPSLEIAREGIVVLPGGLIVLSGVVVVANTFEILGYLEGFILAYLLQGLSVRFHLLVDLSLVESLGLLSSLDQELDALFPLALLVAVVC